MLKPPIPVHVMVCPVQIIPKLIESVATVPPTALIMLVPTLSICGASESTPGCQCRAPRKRVPWIFDDVINTQT